LDISKPMDPANNTVEAAELQAGFKLNHYFVSPATGEVSMHETVVTLEPKVMDVLLALAASSGEVLSAELLFSQVWPRSIYSPVSVRRSINQLRKVFNDTDKSLIKTHPKRGYSLHASVELIDANQQQKQSTSAPTGKAVNKKHLAAFGIAVICTLLLFFFPPWATQQKWYLSDLQPLTATAEQESYSLFTPDSSSVVYLKQRADEQGNTSTELWLTSLDRQQNRVLYRSNTPIEFFNWVPVRDAKTAKFQLLLASQLTNSVRFFSLSLSADYQVLATIPHFELSGNQRLSPFFSNETQVFFLARQANEHRLYKGDLTTGQVDLLFSPSQQFSPYRIAPSATKNSITMLGFDEQRRSQIKLLSTTTGEITDLKTLDANWYFISYASSFSGYLLSDGKELFHLNEQLQFSKLSFENYAFLHYPSLSPDAQHLTFTQAKIKGNIFRLDLVSHQATPLTRSTMHDWQGSYSPDQSKLAYVSNKNGHSQIFVLDIKSKTERLVYSNSDQHLALSQPVWSGDNTQLAFARNDRLVTINLADKEPMVQHFDQVIGQPRQWLDPADDVVISQTSQPFTRWYQFSVTTEKQNQIAASNKFQVLNKNQRFQIDNQQLQDAEGNPLFEVKSHYRITQHFAKSTGIYLLLSQHDSEEATQIWFFDYSTQVCKQISSISLSGKEISDLSQQHLLYNSFEVEKDIHTLKLNQR
jgi:DNA-binding winged helix-turn-helix (wHTH) protein/Tol biopolymer transport system component